MAGFLGHLSVLDLSRGVAGAYCAKLLADAGAEVIRIESAADRDPLRPLPGDGSTEGIERIEFEAQFAHLNSSKLSIDLDVTTEAGREQLLRLAATVDAVIEDRPPGALDALAIGPAALRAANPSLVVTSITAFGQTGPYRDYRANELLVYAMGARMSGMGIQPRPPVRLAPESSSYFAGAVAAGATLTAVWDAIATGLGDELDLSMVETLLGAPDRMMLMWEFSQRDEMRISATRPLQNFPCSDGHFALGLSRGLERVALAIGLPELVEDPRYRERPQPPEVAAEVEALISGWMVQRTRREAFEFLQDHRVIGGPINGVEDLFDDPQFKHRGAFVDVEAGGRRFRLPGAPFRELGAPAATLGRPPEAGEHTDQVLARLDAPLDASPDAVPAPVVTGGSGGGGGLPLAGLRVIDFGEAYAGPYCCTLLADAGAEVIRVENIHRQPANLRGQPSPAPPYIGYKDRDPGERPWNRSFLHNGIERNKLGITLDVSQPRGRELFLELVAESDVVVTNFARTAIERLGLSYDDLVAVNPTLVMAVVSGYGADGPYRDYAALGSTIDAVAAHQSLRGYPETAPLDSQHSYFSDAITGYTAFFAVMAALHRRRETGEGACLDLALTESLFPVIGPQIGAYSVVGEVPPALGNRDRVAAPQGCYRTLALPEEPESERLTGDRWIAISCRDEDEWQALLGVIGDEDGSEQLSVDARFASLDGRHEHHDALDVILDRWTAQYDSLELMHRLQAAGVPAVALMPDSEVMDDRQLVARGYFTAVDHRDAGRYRAPSPIWRSQRHDIRLRTPAHCLGEHNREVLQGLLGVSDEEFEELETQGIVGEAYSARATSVSR